MDDLLTDFVAETREMLEASASEIIAWEANPADGSRLDAIFRFVHTVKGNCGFFDFPRLADLSHAAEDALADVRAGRRQPDSALVTAVLAVIDRIVEMVDAIEREGVCPTGDDAALIAALEADPTAASPQPHEASEAAPAPEPRIELERAPEAAAPVQRTIRLPVELLDRVMSGVSDMVLARNDLAHRLRQAGNQPTIDGPFERLTSILSDVRDAITRMRMQRIETLFASLPRLVRDLSSELGKQVTIALEGGDVELDREMIEVVRDPLTHIIRNAIDHGIELPAERLKAGKREIALISIAARQSGNTISIVVGDDGRGLDEERIAAKAIATGLIDEAQRAAMPRDKLLNLIFEPGFSTAETVSNISGRGVGLDVVRRNLEHVGGSIEVRSIAGEATLFKLQIPLTLSIIAGLTVELAGQRFAIPQSYVEEIVQSTGEALDFTQMGETALVTFRGQRVPCLSLNDVLALPPSDIPAGERTMVLLRLASGDLFALAVDRIHTHGDLVVKPLAPSVMKSGVYAGSTLLDDGQPVLMLDVANIAAEYRLFAEARARVFNPQLEDEAGSRKAAQRAMLFTDWSGRRCAIRLELVRRIETAPAASVDRSGAEPRVVIDGVILPLVGLPEGPLPADKLRLLRLSDGTCELLYAVREVDDAAELTEPLKRVPEDRLVEAVTLVGGEPVSLIDGHELFALHGEPPEDLEKPRCRLPSSDWSSTILGPLVREAGYEIVTDEEADEKTLGIWFEEEFEIAAELGMEVKGPVIRLRNRPEGAQDCPTIYRYDREGLLQALRRARGDALLSPRTLEKGAA
ncbi:MAG: chemotaxis protein CheA [Erythrobacter sp.]|jgi:two-component system chemotaxis sensor kinase CheA|nr:chemotaxis protein CheA [Erythrobacter sp.]